MKRLTKRLALISMSALLVAGFVLPATAVAARPSATSLLNDIAVTARDSDGNLFTGTLDITEITRVGSGLVFDGTLTNTATGAVIPFTDVAGTLAHGGANAVCDILFLDLGPISLDLLGLTVDLSRIVLDINAVPGAGNLLGNLLCAVAGLLDGSPFGGIGALIDRLLDIINRLLG